MPLPPARRRPAAVRAPGRGVRSPLVRALAAVAAAALAATACTDGGTGPAAATAVTTSTTTTLPPSSTTTSSTSSTTSTTSTTTTTTLPLVTEGSAVLVANAAGVPGAAADLTRALAGRGFTMVEPTNAAAWEARLDATKVYARDDVPAAAAVADSVARVLGGVPVERLPTPVPIAGANEVLGDTAVVVMLGRDLAGRALPGT